MDELCTRKELEARHAFLLRALKGEVTPEEFPQNYTDEAVAALKAELRDVRDRLDDLNDGELP